jgi:ABC-type Fe3+ transport system substrate-binding protein
LLVDEKSYLTKTLTLKSVLKYKKIDETLFLREWDAFKKERTAWGGYRRDGCDVWARIPCMVQLPMQNQLDTFAEESRLDITCDVALVEFGEEWIREQLARERPPVIVAAGVEGMVKNEVLASEYENPGFDEYNADFAGFEDPRGAMRLISGVPLVFVADKTKLPQKDLPLSWGDLLRDEYKRSICYADDGHLLDSVMLAYFYQAYGEDGVRRLGQNCVCGAHPSQMIKAGGIEQDPAVFIMPYVFSALKTKEKNMEVVWPKEGAPIIPIVCTAQKGIGEKHLRLLEYLLGEEMGKVFMRQGLFPSSHKKVQNGLPGKLWWIGFDYLYENDILGIIEKSKQIFLGELQ